MTTTHSGVDSSNDSSSFDTNDDATDAILNRWVDAGMLSKGDGGATSSKGSETDPEDEDEDDNDVSEELDADDSDTDDDDQSEDTSDDDGDDSDESDEGAVEATDDAVVKITVDGEDRTVSVKDLKRLYGQEASLTRKSQEVASARKVAEEEGGRYTVAAQKLLERAQTRFAPYAKLDWLVVQQQLQPEEFAALRTEARSAYEDVQFLESEVNTLFEAAQKDRQATIQEEAKKSVEVLKVEIPEWSQQIYDDVRAYAISQKLDEASVNGLLDPYAIKLIYKAMKFDAATAKAKTKKTAAPTKVLKTKGKAATIMGKSNNADDQMKRLNKEGSAEAAMDVLLARWANADSDT